jgi:hypothetical protein
MSSFVIANYVVIKKEPEEISRYHSGTGTGAKTELHQVLAINDASILESRKVYLDKSSGRYIYICNGFSYEYKINWRKMNSYQLITIEGTTYEVTATTKTIFEWQSELTAMDVKLKVGKYYKLVNGTRIKIIDFAKAEDGICNEDTFIGIYAGSAGTTAIRFSTDGQLLSHCGAKDYCLIGEWTEETVWTIVYRDSSGQRQTKVKIDSNNTLTEKTFTEMIKKEGGVVEKAIATKI